MKYICSIEFPCVIQPKCNNSHTSYIHVCSLANNFFRNLVGYCHYVRRFEDLLKYKEDLLKICVLALFVMTRWGWKCNYFMKDRKIELYYGIVSILIPLNTN